MTELIVALDSEQSFRHIVALRQAGVMFFKLSALAMMEPSFFDILAMLSKIDADWFADMKTYDTRDTVYETARRAFDLGARFLTVHATPSMLEAAMRAKPAGDRCKVLAVSRLTDGGPVVMQNVPSSRFADGVVCDISVARYLRSDETRYFDPADISLPGAYRNIIVCPGIRPAGWPADNHVNPATPAEARDAGADYVVCGRPIYGAPDPVVAARAILDELKE